MPPSLPTERDFNPNGNDLDAACAWRNFGGLSVDAATARFRENPLYFQEDFMFMGTNAFLFYFPVLDSYLRGIPDTEPEDDNESWIVSRCISTQFDENSLHYLRPIADSVLALAVFVCENVHRFGADDAERDRVSSAWGDLASHIAALRQDGG